MKVSALSSLPLLGLTSLLVVSAGCGPGAVGAAVRPEDPTATSALDDKVACHDVESGGEPLVVDWKPEQRGDLEEAMHDGVAVVAYSCEGIKLLKQCHIEGQYGFLGMTKREQVVKLSNSDELRANLPSIGGPMALKLSGEMQRGATLDIAMIMIGKKRTTWEDPTTADLKGKCDGATHYVRGALVGAFVMKTGTKGQVAVAGQMFGVDAGASSSSEKDVRNQDGDPADCAKASPDSEKAPPQCGAAVRLTLSPIVKGGDAQPAADAQAKAAPDEDTACPKGLVMSEGKCTNPAEATAYLCKMGDAAECTAQCDKGHAGSCGNLGRMYASGNGVDQDWAKAGEALQKGCDGGEAKACVGLGQLTFNGRGRKEDPAAAVTLYDKACAAGDADGCGLLGQAYLNGKGTTADPAKAASFFEKSCDGGNDAGCYDLGKLYSAGSGVTQDNGKAAELYKRACDGSQAEACDLLGVMYETGAGVRNDKIFASMLYRRGCDRNSPDACVDLGRILMGGGAGGSPDDAKRLFERGCMQQAKMGCAVLKLAFGGTQPVFPDVAKAQALQQSCVRGNARDCATLGVMSLASGNTQGSFNLQMACQRGDQFACAIEKVVKKP